MKGWSKSMTLFEDLAYFLKNDLGTKIKRYGERRPPGREDPKAPLTPYSLCSSVKEIRIISWYIFGVKVYFFRVAGHKKSS